LLELHSFPTRRSSDLLSKRGIAFRFFCISALSDQILYRKSSELAQRFAERDRGRERDIERAQARPHRDHQTRVRGRVHVVRHARSEEHTSELQSRENL